MKIISALGGGGSTFIFRNLNRLYFKPSYLGFNFYKIEQKVMKYSPFLLNHFKYLMRLIKAYQPQYKVLKRPDAFWTDRNYHKTGYNPNGKDFSQNLRDHKNYILKLYIRRSAGIKIFPSYLKDDTLSSLVKSYIERIKHMEKKLKIQIVLLSSHWGEFGILKEIGVKTIYLIRDPYNSIISHSTFHRHQKDYLRRGLKDINTKECIDTYLKGPHHYWIYHAKTALTHKNAIIIRYNKFKEDWQKIKDLPDISHGFKYSENNIKKIFTKESIQYIYEQTHEICDKLSIDNPDI